MRACKCYESCFSQCSFLLLVSYVVYETESDWACSLGILTSKRLSLLGLFLLLWVHLFFHGGFSIELAFHLLCAGVGHTTHAAHIFGLLVDLLHVVAWSKHLVLHHAAHAVRRSVHLLLSFALFATALVKRRVQLDLGIFEDIAQVLRNAVLWTQVLLSKVDGLLVTQDGCGVGSEELLFDTHVVIGNGKDGRTIL